jgi:hypothetical protein
LPDSMSASVTREIWKVSTDVRIPLPVTAELTGIPVRALIVSTCSPSPPNTAGPAVMVSVGCPPVVESATVTSGMVDTRRRTPSRISGSPAPGLPPRTAR